MLTTRPRALPQLTDLVVRTSPESTLGFHSSAKTQLSRIRDGFVLLCIVKVRTVRYLQICRSDYGTAGDMQRRSILRQCLPLPNRNHLDYGKLEPSALDCGAPRRRNPCLQQWHPATAKLPRQYESMRRAMHQHADRHNQLRLLRHHVPSGKVLRWRPIGHPLATFGKRSAVFVATSPNCSVDRSSIRS